jgi:threonine dehydratase
MTFRSDEAGLDGLDGPIVAVVSGGNVDPDRYRTFLEAPIPARG